MRWQCQDLMLTLSLAWTSMNTAMNIHHHDPAYNLPLQWRHNERDGISNHRRLDCLLDCLFRRRSQNTSKLRVTGLCEGTLWSPVNFLHKEPVTRQKCPFDDVIMLPQISILICIISSRFVHRHKLITLACVQWSRCSAVCENSWYLHYLHVKCSWCIRKLNRQLHYADA